MANQKPISPLYAPAARLKYADPEAFLAFMRAVEAEYASNKEILVESDPQNILIHQGYCKAFREIVTILKDCNKTVSA